MASGNRNTSPNARCPALSLRLPKIKRNKATEESNISQETEHYPIFNEQDPRHNPSAVATAASEPAGENGSLGHASWKQSLPMRSLRKARSGLLALASGVRRRPSIFRSNDNDESTTNDNPLPPNTDDSSRGTVFPRIDDSRGHDDLPPCDRPPGDEGFHGRLSWISRRIASRQRERSLPRTASEASTEDDSDFGTGIYRTNRPRSWNFYRIAFGAASSANPQGQTRSPRRPSPLARTVLEPEETLADVDVEVMESFDGGVGTATSGRNDLDPAPISPLEMTGTQTTSGEKEHPNTASSSSSGTTIGSRTSALPNAPTPIPDPNAITSTPLTNAPSSAAKTQGHGSEMSSGPLSGRFYRSIDPQCIIRFPSEDPIETSDRSGLHSAESSGNVAVSQRCSGKSEEKSSKPTSSGRSVNEKDNPATHTSDTKKGQISCVESDASPFGGGSRASSTVSERKESTYTVLSQDREISAHRRSGINNTDITSDSGDLWSSLDNNDLGSLSLNLASLSLKDEYFLVDGKGGGHRPDRGNNRTKSEPCVIPDDNARNNRPRFDRYSSRGAQEIPEIIGPRGPLTIHNSHAYRDPDTSESTDDYGFPYATTTRRFA